MWFKKPSVPLSAAVVLAMESECYMIAMAFFTLGVCQRITERNEEEREEN